MPLYQFSDLIRPSLQLLQSRASPNDNNFGPNDNSNDYDNDDSSARNHRRVEIGVIVAIVIVGLAIISCAVTFIIKRRQRQEKKIATPAGQDIEWYEPDDGSQKAVAGQESRGKMGAGKAGFRGEVGVEAPPSYQMAVKSGTGGEVK